MVERVGAVTGEPREPGLTDIGRSVVVQALIVVRSRSGSPDRDVDGPTRAGLSTPRFGTSGSARTARPSASWLEQTDDRQEETMSPSTFFEYVHAHESTAGLAAELSELLIARARRGATAPTSEDAR